MKKKLLCAARAIAFCAILCALIAGASDLLERKESREKLDPFFERARDIDVLFLGDSHMLSAVYPMQLWHDYGITSYNLASYNNTIPVSYWLMRCVMEACTPKLVVVDINYINYYGVVGGRSGDVHTALDGLPMSRTKRMAIDDLMSDPEAMDDYGNRYVDLKKEFFFPLALYHSRWSELTREDFQPTMNSQLGAQMQISVAEPADYDIIADAVDEQGVGFEYLRRIIDECGRRGVQVLLVNVPFPPAGDEDQLYSNAVYYLAEECDVDYIDFVYMDQIVDYSTDCYDPSSHLNPSGARKVTDYLGEYITEVCGVPDRRQEAELAGWDADYDAYIDTKIQLFREQLDLKCFLMLLHDADFSACVSVPAGSALYQDEGMKQMLQNVGRRHLFEADTYESVWADGLFPLERLEEAAAQGAPYLAVIDRERGVITEEVGGDAAALDTSFGRVAFDGRTLRIDRDGGQAVQNDQERAIRVAVIDRRTDEVVMLREFSM